MQRQCCTPDSFDTRSTRRPSQNSVTTHSANLSLTLVHFCHTHVHFTLSVFNSCIIDVGRAWVPNREEFFREGIFGVLGIIRTTDWQTQTIVTYVFNRLAEVVCISVQLGPKCQCCSNTKSYKQRIKHERDSGVLFCCGALVQESDGCPQCTTSAEISIQLLGVCWSIH